jgi:tRNA threonylcarbamoyladenosine modification (KEOPS) complex Cgi121 subunit
LNNIRIDPIAMITTAVTTIFRMTDTWVWTRRADRLSGRSIRCRLIRAACTALMALESGLNVALMAPTEILAEQHCRNFQH